MLQHLVLLLSVSIAVSDITVNERQTALDIHNYYRAQVALGLVPGQPKAANMFAFEYDDRPEERAEVWAKECQMAHDSAGNRVFEGYTWVGQNRFFWIGGTYNISEAVESWFREYRYFDFVTKSCQASKQCGHYKALIWYNTKYMGCDLMEHCNPHKVTTNIFCNYAPGGNMPARDGNDVPYNAGEPCSQCPAGRSFCLGKALCATERACKTTESGCKCTITSCQNEGVLDESSCTCKCADNFQGKLCEESCRGQPCDKPDDDVQRNTHGIVSKIPGVNAVTSNACIDNKSYCRYWASIDACINYRNYMRRNCKKSCKFCRVKKVVNAVKAPQCIDDNDNCPGWEKNGQCIENPSYMVPHCRKSCGFCGCQNKSVWCDNWAKSGQCSSNARYMLYNCMISCGICKK